MTTSRSTRRVAAAAVTAALAAGGWAAASGDAVGATEAAGHAKQPRHQPRFVAHVRKLSPKTRRTMTGVSWKPGCPVGLDALRVVRMRFWGFDGHAHMGRLIVNADVAKGTVKAFRVLYRHRFPIRRMVPVDAYGGSDDASMAADNTSAFNCRPVTGTTDRWSNHSFGRAIDIDTIENPYVKGSTVLPPAGRDYLDRTDVRPGMIVAGGLVTAAFDAQGFDWGGDYTSLKDYQHFEVIR
jgi:D-alanyl-D-alanine carboxypeptidase